MSPRKTPGPRPHRVLCRKAPSDKESASASKLSPPCMPTKLTYSPLAEFSLVLSRACCARGRMVSAPALPRHRNPAQHACFVLWMIHSMAQLPFPGQWRCHLCPALVMPVSSDCSSPKASASSTKTISQGIRVSANALKSASRPAACAVLRPVFTAMARQLRLRTGASPVLHSSANARICSSSSLV